MCIASFIIVSSSTIWQQAGAFVCGGGCTRHMCHLIIMVDLLYFPGIWYVRASSESDKRHQERGIWTPGEHRRHWRCWASDREAEIQGWFQKHVAVHMLTQRPHFWDVRPVFFFFFLKMTAQSTITLKLDAKLKNICPSACAYEIH